MNSTLKKVLKIGAAIAIPGAILFLAAKKLTDELDKAEFREYVRKTYGEGSKYEHVEF